MVTKLLWVQFLCYYYQHGMLMRPREFHDNHATSALKEFLTEKRG